MNTVVAYPQANGLVERANKCLIEGIKIRLGRDRVGWVDELPNVLWAHMTSLKQSNGDAPFGLTYGKRREAATIREARYKTKMEQYYNKKVRPMSFKPGEFVLKKNEASRIGDQGKLGPTWEGPYRVTEAYQNGLLHEKFYNSPGSAPNRCRVV
ncbi:reverse transcriptase domain-containing protein [Tanacetum coccineum]